MQVPVIPLYTVYIETPTANKTIDIQKMDYDDSDYGTSGLSKIVVDGDEFSPYSAKSFTFTTAGEHTIEYYFNRGDSGYNDEVFGTWGASSGKDIRDYITKVIISKDVNNSTRFWRGDYNVALPTYFAGTKAEWEDKGIALNKYSFFLDRTVHCTDGDVTK